MKEKKKNGSRMGKKTGKLETGLSVCLWSFVADFPECSARVKRTWPSDGSGHDPARARASSISLSREHRNAGRIALSPTGRRSISYEYCCPRRYMTSSAAWCSPKICTEARTLDVPLALPCTRPYSFRNVTWTFYDQNFYSRRKSRRALCRGTISAHELIYRD